jgi:uncharacterized protein YggT (Ycf19 family)
MNEPQKVAEDEERRLRQHEAIKSEVRDEIHGKIKSVTEGTEPAERARVQGVAHDLKERAVTEVEATEAELVRARRAARTSQVVDYFFGLIYGIVGLVCFLDLVGARDSTGFMRFLNALAAPLLVPFKGLMPDPRAGSFQLRLSYLVALIVYGLCHVAVRGFFRLFVYKKTSV